MRPALMQATSRESIGLLRDAVDSATGPLDAAATVALGDDLYAVGALLDGQVGLRRALADPSAEAEARSGLVRRLLDGKVSSTALDLVSGAAGSRWSVPSDLVDALLDAASQTTLAAAEKGRTIDAVEDELFRFGRVLDASGELEQTLSDVTAPADQKRTLLDGLLGDKVDPLTLSLLERAVRTPRAQSTYSNVRDLSDLAARRRSRSVALVTSPVSLTQAQQKRLGDALARIYGRPVELAVDLDPEVLGGLRVQVGDEVIDGTVAHRLDELRRRFGVS